MAKTNPFKDFFSPADFSKIMENYKAAPFDMKALMETQRKNFQALTEAQQAAMEGFQALAQRQSEIISRAIEDNSAMAKEMMTEGSPEEKIAKNARLFKSPYERSLKQMQELSDLISESRKEASSVISKRVSATMNEIQSSVEKPAKSSGSKKAA